MPSSSKYKMPDDDPEDDPYEVLGVPLGASDDEIRKAYKRLALRLHPDKQTATANTPEQRAETAEQFHSVQHAKTFLLNPIQSAIRERTRNEQQQKVESHKNKKKKNLQPTKTESSSKAESKTNNAHGSCSTQTPSRRRPDSPAPSTLKGRNPVDFSNNPSPVVDKNKSKKKCPCDPYGNPIKSAEHGYGSGRRKKDQSERDKKARGEPRSQHTQKQRTSSRENRTKESAHPKSTSRTSQQPQEDTSEDADFVLAMELTMREEYDQAVAAFRWQQQQRQRDLELAMEMEIQQQYDRAVQAERRRMQQKREEQDAQMASQIAKEERLAEQRRKEQEDALYALQLQQQLLDHENGA